MFPVKHAKDSLVRAAAWSGFSLTERQLESLETLARWLVDEAIPAGGIGPDEADRIIDRHVADSLVFGAGWRDAPPSDLVDVGSGVGLPGIPLAVAFPETAVTLLERSQRRTDLAARSIRILGLGNVTAVRGEIATHQNRYAAATFRGSLTPAAAVVAARHLLVPGGTAVIGIRRGPDPGEIPEAGPGERFEVLRTADGVLDSPAWNLRMTTT
jgi:16S rRNA (guanine527-N7)-methyltransferase